MLRRALRKWGGLAAVFALLVQGALYGVHTHEWFAVDTAQACIAEAAAADPGKCGDTDHTDDACSICQALNQGRFGLPAAALHVYAVGFTRHEPAAPVPTPPVARATEYKHSPRAPPSIA